MVCRRFLVGNGPPSVVCNWTDRTAACVLALCQVTGPLLRLILCHFFFFERIFLFYLYLLPFPPPSFLLIFF